MGYGSRIRRSAKRALAREFKISPDQIKEGELLCSEAEQVEREKLREDTAKHRATLPRRISLACSLYAKRLSDSDIADNKKSEESGAASRRAWAHQR